LVFRYIGNDVQRTSFRHGFEFRKLLARDFNRDHAKAALTAMGVKNVREAGRYSLHMDDPFGYDVQISGLEAHALSDG